MLTAQISSVQRDKVLSYIEGARSQGAEILTGGKGWDESKRGYWVEPTIIAGATAESAVTKEEVSSGRNGTQLEARADTQIFGPVIVAHRFREESEGVALANDSIYGLAAAVFSNDAKQTKRVAHSLKAGTVWINQYCVLHPGIPFGGFKQSGIGRELGSLGLEGYLQVSVLIVCCGRGHHHR